MSWADPGGLSPNRGIPGPTSNPPEHTGSVTGCAPLNSVLFSDVLMSSTSYLNGLQDYQAHHQHHIIAASQADYSADISMFQSCHIWTHSTLPFGEKTNAPIVHPCAASYLLAGVVILHATIGTGLRQVLDASPHIIVFISDCCCCSSARCSS